jgi:iron complex transport system substrate-binding protein
MHHRHGRLFTILCIAFLFAQPANAAPQRVVSTFLCTDEYVFRLVPREHIAALSYEALDRHPVVSTISDAAVGIRTIHPSTEAVLALKPDLVVMYANTETHLRANLLRLGVPVLDVPWANSLSDVRAITAMLGQRLDAVAKARALQAEMDRKITAARATAPRPPVRGILYEPNGYVNSGGVTDEILQIAGIKEAVPPGGLTRAGTLPVESIVAAAPELLILGGEPRAGSARAYAVLQHPALRALRGRTYIRYAVLTPLLCPGPWSVDSAKTLGNLARKTRALAPVRTAN